MTLDSKALEAAHESYSTHGQTGDLRRQRISDDLMSAVISAYLSALPAGEVGELVADLRDEDFRHEMQHLRSSSEIDRLFMRAATTLLSLSARCGEMERALEPLVKLAAAVFHVDEGGREMNAGKPDDAAVWGFDRAMLTYGDLRRARAALSRRATTGGNDE